MPNFLATGNPYQTVGRASEPRAFSTNARDILVQVVINKVYDLGSWLLAPIGALRQLECTEGTVHHPRGLGRVNLAATSSSKVTTTTVAVLIQPHSNVEIRTLPGVRGDVIGPIH